MLAALRKLKRQHQLMKLRLHFLHFLVQDLVEDFVKHQSLNISSVSSSSAITAS